MEYNIERNQIHSTLLADLYKNGMKYLEKSASDISLAAIASGPGSYTGLRIGMSFIKVGTFIYSEKSKDHNNNIRKQRMDTT